MKKRHCADDFVSRVDSLYARTIAGKRTDAKSEKREIKEVAFALAQIRILINRAFSEITLSSLPATALVAAADLLDALMRGTDHPVWTYINEGRSQKRANKAPASSIDNMRRAWLVGILRALQNDASPPLSRRSAAKRIADHGGAVLGAELTPDQIIGWDKTFSEQNDPLPNAVRKDISTHAGPESSDENTILRIGIGQAYWIWGLPGGVGELKAPPLSLTAQ